MRWNPAHSCSHVGLTRRIPASAADKKVLRDAAKTMEDKSLSAEERLAAVQSSDIEQLHETNPLRDGLSESNPQRFRVERPKSSFASWYQFFPRSEGAYYGEDGKIVPGNLKTSIAGLERAAAEGSTLCICRRSSRLA